MIIINISDVYDSVPGIIICIFFSIITVPLIRLDFLFFGGIVIISLIVLREFNITSSTQKLNNDPTVTTLNSTHIIMTHIEITFSFFITFLYSKRSVILAKFTTNSLLFYLVWRNWEEALLGELNTYTSHSINQEDIVNSSP